MAGITKGENFPSCVGTETDNLSSLRHHRETGRSSPAHWCAFPSAVTFRAPAPPKAGALCVPWLIASDRVLAGDDKEAAQRAFKECAAEERDRWRSASSARRSKRT